MENNILFEYLTTFENYILCKLNDSRTVKDEKEKMINLILDSNQRNKITFQKLVIQLTKRISKFNEWCNLRKNKISIIERRQQKFKEFIANKIEDDL